MEISVYKVDWDRYQNDPQRKDPAGWMVPLQKPIEHSSANHNDSFCEYYHAIWPRIPIEFRELIEPLVGGLNVNNKCDGLPYVNDKAVDAQTQTELETELLAADGCDFVSKVVSPENVRSATSLFESIEREQIEFAFNCAWNKSSEDRKAVSQSDVFSGPTELLEYLTNWCTIFDEAATDGLGIGVS